MRVSVGEILKNYQTSAVKPLTKESSDIQLIKKITSSTDILLKELSASQTNAQGIKFNIENSKIFKNQTIGYDLNTLKSLAKDDPKLAQLLEKLEGMLGKNEPKPTINPALEQKISLKNEQMAQNAQVVSTKDDTKIENQKTLTSNESLKSEVATKQKIDQSGIFFENRLKESLLPANQKSAFIHVVKNAEAFLKNAPLENVDTRQIADLLEVLKNSPSKSVHTERYETLSKALNDALTQAIKNSQNQPLFSLSDKLGKVEQLTTSKDLGGFKMALKELVEEIKNPLTPIPKDVNSLTLRRFEILKTQIIQTAQELEPILQSKEIPELQTLVRTKELNFNIQTLNFSTQPPLSTNSLSPNLDIGDKLKLAINQIKTSIALLAPRSAKISSSLANAQSAINSLAKLEVNEPNLTDLKQTVMQMRDTSQNRELITTCSKIISQIEMNQLYSLTSNSIYTFSPYMWDGVKKGNIKLKTENEKSYCQIRLDFERFKRVNVLLGLFEQKYLHVNFSFESKNLENIAVENLSELKKLMVDAGILLSSVSIVPFADSNFFENDNLKDEFGIDIRT